MLSPAISTIGLAKTSARRPIPTVKGFLRKRISTAMYSQSICVGLRNLRTDGYPSNVPRVRFAPFETVSSHTFAFVIPPSWSRITRLRTLPVAFLGRESRKT